MKRYILTFLAVFGFIVAKAQPEVTLPYMRNVFQATYVNPTIIPEHTFGFGFSVFGQAISNGFLPKNFLNYRNDTMHVNLNSLLGDMNDKNLLYVGQNADLFHMRAKILNSYIWFAFRQNATVTLQYPRELFSLAIEGNKPYVGSTLDLSNLNANASVYNEYTFGFLKDFPNWTFGGRISLLQGLANVSFDPSLLKIDIDTAMYYHTASADGQLRTAGIPKNAAGEPSFDHIDGQWITNKLTGFQNEGLAIAGGVTYKQDERMRISFSFYDIGFITWKDSIQTYTLKGQTEFKGLDILGDLLAGRDVNTDSIFQKIEDDFTRDTIYQSYRTWLNPKFNFTASYDLAKRTTLGVTFAAFYNKRLYPSVTLGLSQGIGRFFNVVATASVYQRSIPNLGVGLLIKPGPFQIFVVADNLYPAIDPLAFTNANVRVGLNLVFGRINQPEGLPYK